MLALLCLLPPHGTEQERWKYVTETVYIHLASRDVLSPAMLYYILNIFHWNGHYNPESSSQAHHRLNAAEIDWDIFDNVPVIPAAPPAPPIPLVAGLPNSLLDHPSPITPFPIRRRKALAEQQAARFDVRITGPNNDVRIAFEAHGNEDGTTRKSKCPRK